MSSSVLEKLKAKPVAKKIEQVKIKIVQPGIEEKIEIKRHYNIELEKIIREYKMRRKFADFCDYCF